MQNIELRPVEYEDVFKIKKLRNQYKQFLRQDKLLRDIDQKRWYESEYFKDNIIYSIYSSKSDYKYFSGYCGLTYINFLARNAEISIIDDDYCGEVAKDALIELEKIAVNEWNLKKLYINIYSFDEKKIKLCEENGYKKEAILIDHIYYSGYHDYYIYSKIIGG